MDITLVTLIVNAIATPILVLITMWLKSIIARGERDERRHDGYISNLERRIQALEKEVREVRVELKNRDAEYLALYKDYTTLKAKHEVLQVDHEELKKLHDEVAAELTALKDDIKKKAEETARAMQQL